MPDKLPKGWVKTNLGEVCLPVANIRPEDSPDTEFTYFDIGGIDNEKYRIAETKTIIGRNAPSRARQALQQDDILFSTVRTYLRKIARLERGYPNPVASTGFAVIRAAKGVSSQFLFFQVLSENFLQPLHALQTGTSYPAVRASDVFAQPILLPPTSEQERIVTKLDAALSRLERAEKAAHRAKERLKLYRAAVLHTAVTGELTKDWRKTHKSDETGTQLLQRLLRTRRARWEKAELLRLQKAGKLPKDDKWKSRYPEPAAPEVAGLPKLPVNWTWASAGQLTEATRPITYGVVKLGAVVGGGVPVLRSSDVRHLDLELDHVKRIAKGIADEYQRTYLKGGEVLVTVRGTLGGVVQVPEECAGYNISREVAVLALLEPRTSRAIAYFIGSDILQHWLQSRTKGIAYTGINIETLRTLPIPIMPLAELARIVNEVQRRLSAADKMAATLHRQFERSSATHQSLLSEAFAGRLASQAPNDEPASVLLERIRASREAEAKKPKGKRMSKSKVKPTRRVLLDVLRQHKKPMTPEQLFRESGFQQEFEENEWGHDVVDKFYEELSAITGSRGPVTERRPDRNTVLLEVKS